MIRNFEYLIVFTSAPGVLPEQNDRYRIQAWKVNEIKAYKNRPKPIIRTGFTVPNVQKCVMVATLTLIILLYYDFADDVFYIYVLYKTK